ncbi:hypothetical protein Tco_0162951 [Tanacetum coccineum]
MPSSISLLNWVNAILEKDENGPGLFVDIRELKSVAVKECSGVCLINERRLICSYKVNEHLIKNDTFDGATTMKWSCQYDIEAYEIVRHRDFFKFDISMGEDGESSKDFRERAYSVTRLQCDTHRCKLQSGVGIGKPEIGFAASSPGNCKREPAGKENVSQS